MNSLLLLSSFYILVAIYLIDSQEINGTNTTSIDIINNTNNVIDVENVTNIGIINNSTTIKNNEYNITDILNLLETILKSKKIIIENQRPMTQHFYKQDLFNQRQNPLHQKHYFPFNRQYYYN